MTLLHHCEIRFFSSSPSCRHEHMQLIPCVSFHPQQLFYSLICFLFFHVASYALFAFVLQAGHQHDVSLRSAVLRCLGSGGNRSALNSRGRPRTDGLVMFDTCILHSTNGSKGKYVIHWSTNQRNIRTCFLSWSRRDDCCHLNGGLVS